MGNKEQVRNGFWVAVPPLGVRGLRWQLAQWFELRWWRKYLHGKTKEEYLSWKRNYWTHLLAYISNEIKIGSISPLSFGEGPGVRTKSIVDLGCGPAGIFILTGKGGAVGVQNFEPLQHHPRSIIAVDPLIDEYEKQISFFKKSDYPDTTFIKSTIEEFNPSQKFDLVFCMNAINHVNNIEKGFETLKKVCAHDGRIVISIDAHNYSFFKYLFRLLPGDILHPHQYNLQEYKTMLAKNGWKVSVPYLLKEQGLFNHYVLIARKC